MGMNPDGLREWLGQASERIKQTAFQFADAWDSDLQSCREGWRYADELEAERKRLTARVEELEAKLSRCGQENCMGWRDEDVASWVREERFLDSQKRVEELEAALRGLCGVEMPDSAQWEAAALALGEK